MNSLKIKIKRPSLPPDQSQPSPERSKRRKRPRVESEGDDDEPAPAPKKPARRTGDGDKPKRNKKSAATREFTPTPPPEPLSKKRSRVEDEDEDYVPASKRERRSPDLDIEDSASPPPALERKKSKAEVTKKPGNVKKKPKPQRNVVMSDSDGDYEDTPTSPQPRGAAKGKSKANASTTIVARDERKMPAPETKAKEDVPHSAAESTIAVDAPKEAPKPKLPVIKKKPQAPGTQIPGAAGSANRSPMPPRKEETKEAAKPLVLPGQDLDLRDANIYNQLFSGGGRIQKKEKDDARKKELEAMRTAAREQRERQYKQPFDMLAHSAAMNKFETRLKDRRNWPSPSQLGSAFVMAARSRTRG